MKDEKIAFRLTLLGLIGYAGLQHVYIGNSIRGLIWYSTFGLFGIGTIYDIITIKKQTREKNRDMGFFSFKTIEGKSISNAFSSKGAFKVYMLSNKKQYMERAYQGYGVFGDKDFFVLTYEMNTKKKVDPNNQKEIDIARDKGMKIFESDDNNTIFPIFTTDKHRKWENKKPELCELQGYFYKN